MTDRKPEIDIDEDDIDDIFDSLPSPAGLTSGEIARQNYARELASLAERDPWQATRRILYIHSTECQNCGRTHVMPNHRVLTEYAHRDGRRKHSTTADQNTSLPLEKEFLPVGESEICQQCMADTDTDTWENDE